MEDLIPNLPSAEQTQVDEAITISPQLRIDYKDGDLLYIIDQKIKEATTYYKDKIKLDERRKRNENYWLGKQHDEGQMYDFELARKYTDNVIHRNTENRIILAASRMPDITVIPESQDPQALEDARDVEQDLDYIVKSDMTKRLMKNVLRDLHINLQAAVKVRWDENKGDKGDIVFERVHVNKLVTDHTATIPEDGYSADNMEFVAEWIEEPLSLAISKFPNKKDDLLAKFGFKQGTDRQLQSKIRYREVWASWYSNTGKLEEIVFWRYQDLILGKSKNPYYSYSGGKNFFERPRKPYIFPSYENLGYSPVEDTSPIEQTIDLQNTINRRGMQITLINDRSVPKNVFAGKYIDKGDARRVTQDPDESIWLKDAEDVRQAFTTINAPTANPGLYQDQAANRMQADSHFATHGTTRGEQVAQESGISKQITREGDLTISDDISNIVVQRVVSEMAGWALQIKKMYYVVDPTQPEVQEWVTKIPGPDQEFKTITMNQDKIHDGISVYIKASNVDKQARVSQALELARIKSIDPYTLFEEMDVPNPKERTKRLMLFLGGGGPNGDGFARYMQDLKIEPTAEAGLTPTETPQVTPEDAPGMPPEGMPPAAPEQPEPAPQDPAQDQQKAEQDIQMILQGEMPEIPETPSETYVSVIAAFVSSPQFDELTPEQQQAIQGYIQTLSQLVDQQLGGSVQ
jgi:hypothetical protein